MQLLEVTKKMFYVFSVLFMSAGVALAEVDCRSANITNPDVINCSQKSFEKIDKVLNEQYKALMPELDSSTRAELLSTQKKWITFRNEYCKSDDEEAGESPIEQLSCMKQLTSFRVAELVYLRTGVIGDGFYKAVSLANEKATAMNYPEALKFVGGSEDFGPAWKGYAEENCAITSKLFGEAEDRCMARMRFQIPIY
ncbi:lysozyme inhibitor LprI family protein [Pseudomonas sp. NPDC088429]|jgi:uncharacterized protein YecT (DUF1311 family)|uniref:lysozyme inhibitor LprI family protein n=1 Tax=Pseudomonas sp. NPDC088429 TaxID=3364455 RepID=UPI00381EE46F